MSIKIKKPKKPRKPQLLNPNPTFLNRLTQIDTEISLKIYNLFNPILPRSFLKLLEISGDGRLFFPIVISLLLHYYYYYHYNTTNSNNNNNYYYNGEKFNLLANLLIGGILDLIFIGSIKHLIRRPRPVYNKNMFLTFAVDHWSFPSGHSSRVFYVASFCHAYFEEIVDFIGFDDGGGFLMVVVIWAAATSFSRVLMGRHFVMDVLAGACLGVVEALLVFRALNYRNLVGWIK